MRKQGCKKRIFIPAALAVVLLLALAVAGCAIRPTRAVEVRTAVAADQELQADLEFSGVLAPARTADISSQISGQVASLGFQPGSAVKTGDVLMTLNTDALNAQIAQAEAGLQSALAAAEAAGTQASLAKIGLNAAQKAYDRTKSLFDSGAASQSQLDDARDKLDTASGQYENAVGPARDQAEAAVSTARANIRNLEVQLDHATVRSPLDGILASQNVHLGEVVAPGAAVMTVVDTSTLKLKSTAGQDTLPLLVAGQEMDVTVDSFPGSKLQGTISVIGPIAVSTGEVFPVEITVKNDGRLMAGLSARASVAARAKGVVVPAAAVAQSGGASCVFVIRDNTALKRPVSTGLKTAGGALILQGLAAGERVAITNTGALSDNTPVSLRSEK